jgi:hypothetical protein
VMGVAIVVGGMLLEYGSFTLLFITMGLTHILATVIQARILKK